MIYIFVHISISILVYFIGYGRANKQERFCNAVLTLAFPVGGLFILLILHNSKDGKIKVIKDTDEVKPIIMFTDTLMSREREFVPLEESLYINNTNVKRRQVINALKKDTMSYLDGLKVALKDEDVETSHYAASAIAELKRGLDLKIQQYSVMYEEDKENLELMEDYIEVLEEYLNSNLLDPIQYKKVKYTYSSILENRIMKNKEEPKYYYKLINMLMDLNELAKAENYCKEYLKLFQSEKSYLANMKYYYNMKDYNNFKKTLKALMESQVRLSNEGINIVRFWLDGA